MCSVAIGSIACRLAAAPRHMRAGPTDAANNAAIDIWQRWKVACCIRFLFGDPRLLRDYYVPFDLLYMVKCRRSRTVIIIDRWPHGRMGDWLAYSTKLFISVPSHMKTSRRHTHDVHQSEAAVSHVDTAAQHFCRHLRETRYEAFACDYWSDVQYST